MINELIFLGQALAISLFALLSLYLGKSALVAFISLNCILANLFVLKQTTLFGLTATCCDSYTIGAVLGLNLLQEYYGKPVAQKAILTSFCLLLVTTIMSFIQTSYRPHTNDTAHLHFELLLTCIPHIAAASLLVYLLVQYLDSFLYAYLKQWCHGRYLLLRTAVCIASTQFLDTFLFTLLVFYDRPYQEIFSIIGISYSIKLLAILIATPYITASQWIYTHKGSLPHDRF